VSEGIDVVALKSFGDLVITLTSMGRSDSALARSSRVLLGTHLQPLYSATGSTVPAVLVEHGEGNVPSFYDVRKRGWRSGLASGLRLRRALGREAGPTWLVDRITWRERFLAQGRPLIELPQRENIYLAYEALFGASGVEVAATASGARVGIFPGSRLASKNLPLGLVTAVQDAIVQAGGRPTVQLLDEERPDLEQALPGVRIVARSFEAMIAAVGECDAIVSADSMPAHLAEMAGIPVFVFSPVDNRYWLPRSAYVEDRWAQFDDAEHKLGRFLNHSKD
jgi:hypothetical protein